MPSLTITPNTTEPTNDDVLLTIKGFDEHSGVKNLLHPDGYWLTSGDQFTYQVKQNGTFLFAVSDNAGNITFEQFSVDNIDKTISFEIPTISTMNDITLSAEPTIHSTDMTAVNVKDWRDGSNDWRIDVSASRVTMADGDYKLPAGTLNLKPLAEIAPIAGSENGNGNLPDPSMTATTAIDNGIVTVAEATNSRGEFDLIFPDSALELLIDPTTAIVNDPSGTTYGTTITWDLVTAP